MKKKNLPVVPNCVNCSRYKVRPGWWDARTSRAFCSEDLFEGQKTYLKNPFRFAPLFILTSAERCESFDNMLL